MKDHYTTNSHYLNGRMYFLSLRVQGLQHSSCHFYLVYATALTSTSLTTADSSPDTKKELCHTQKKYDRRNGHGSGVSRISIQVCSPVMIIVQSLWTIDTIPGFYRQDHTVANNNYSRQDCGSDGESHVYANLKTELQTEFGRLTCRSRRTK